MANAIFENLNQETNLISDLFSRVVFSDINACQDLIRIVLGDDFTVTSVTTQKDITNLQFHSVVLDILAETKNGKQVHIEFQITDNDDHLRRVRYCTACIDTHTLLPGQKYRELPDIYHIFISVNDFLKGGKALYEIERSVKNNNNFAGSVAVANGIHELYINLEVPIKDNSELACLLRYIRHTVPENEDARFGNIVKSVNECRKGNESMKYYSSEEFFEEGMKEQKNIIIRNMLKEHVEPELISRYTLQSVEYVREIEQEMLQSVHEQGNYQTQKEQ
ncbi:MAG: PD-(D/E)XK nuclease family transposase [Lachnospiraceae bacterium]|nr:PD-(D/E)XK nuclease family transposase [Lachnospiraceae bacterium]